MSRPERWSSLSVDEKTPMIGYSLSRDVEMREVEVAAALQAETAQAMMRDQERKARRKRIMRGMVFWGVMLWVLFRLAALGAVTGWFAREGRAFWGGDFGPVEYNHKPGYHHGHEHDHHHHHGWAIPESFDVTSCPSFDENEVSKFDFNIPTDSSTILVYTNGPFSIGHLDIVQSDEEGDDVKIDVTTNLEEDEHKDPRGWLERHVKICELKGKEDETERGVGIFTRRWHHRHHSGHGVNFDIKVTFPKGKDGGPLSIKRFATHLGIFSVESGDFADGITFESFNLSTVVAPIFVKSVTAGTISVRNAAGKIEGNFNSTDAIILETANAPIKANVTITNEKGSSEPASVILRTANAALDSNVTLVNGTSSDPGSFFVKATTARGALTLNVPFAPVNSTVHLSGSTALGPAIVSLPSTYEGSFKLATSLGSASVEVDEAKEDPEGRERGRKVEYETISKWNIKGTTSWGESNEKGKARGSVEVGTALSSVVLNL